MSKLRLYGSTSGYNELTVPAVADNSEINVGGLAGNTYINDSFVLNGGSTNVGFGTTTPNTIIQVAGGIAVGSIVSTTGSTTWDVSTHQSLKVTASGSTTVTISNASSTPIGAGFALIVQDASSASLTLSASPTPKYAGGVAPSLNGTAGEYLIVGLIHVGSGQLLVSYVSLS